MGLGGGGRFFAHRTRSYKKTMSSAHIDRGYEPLLKREGAYVYCTQKEGTRVPSLNTVFKVMQGFSVYTINKPGGRRKMFLTRANMAS